MQVLSVRSYRELLVALSDVVIRVPPRGDKESKRTKEHVERWSICRFLATYGNTRFVRYPLIVEKRERPDYRLNSRGVVVGIEVTEAVSEDMARIDAMRHVEDEITPLDVSLFRPGNPRRSTQELRKILETSRIKDHESAEGEEEEFSRVPARSMGPGWAGDAAEREWSDVMLAVIEAKSTSARKPGYSQFDETWLLIYDNWSFPMLEIPKGVQYLILKLAPLWTKIVFTHIFIEYRREFVRVSAPTYGRRMLNNLWKP